MRRPLKVLAVANWDFRTSPTPWAAMRIEALRRAGAEVELLAIECVADRRGFLRLRSALDRRLEGGRFDVVAPLYGSLLGLLCASQRRVPCALSFAGTDLQGTPNSGGVGALASLSGRVASQLAAAVAPGVSVRTRAMREGLWWPPARRRAEVIPSGVDTARFRPIPRDLARRSRRLPLSGTRVAFVAMGAFTRTVKRIELAREALARLPSAALDVIDGVPLAEMPAAYSAADALILTSRKEGSPNCVKEALACAVPVVSVEVGDVREVLDGLSNCAIAASDPAALAAALARVIRDGRGCPEGPARMAERHSLEAMARRFVEFYQRVAGRAAASRWQLRRLEQVRDSDWWGNGI